MSEIKVQYFVDYWLDLIIDFYVDFVTKVSAISVNEFIHKREPLDLQSNDDIINNIIYEYDKFKLELKDKGTDILLNH